MDVGSEISGIVKSVEADYNDKVKVGQVLARIDTTKYEAQATQSKAALEAAKARVLQAQATVSETRSKLAQYERVRQLSNGKVPSQTEFDAAQAAFERAKADEASATAAVAQAQATLEANQTDIAKAVIHSPIDGIVLTRSIEPGQTVAAAFQAPVLFTLAEDLTQMELHVDVDEADVGQVKEGQEATFSVDAYPNRTFSARSPRPAIGSKTVDGVVTYETVLKVDNTDLCLRPGMTATADITVKKVQDAVLVPGAALRFTPPVQSRKGVLPGVARGFASASAHAPSRNRRRKPPTAGAAGLDVEGGTARGRPHHHRGYGRGHDRGARRRCSAGDGAGDRRCDAGKESRRHRVRLSKSSENLTDHRTNVDLAAGRDEGLRRRARRPCAPCGGSTWISKKATLSR